MRVRKDIFDKIKAQKMVKNLVEEHVRNWFNEKIDYSLDNLIENCVKDFFEHTMKPDIDRAFKEAAGEAKKLITTTINSSLKDPETIKDIMEKIGWRIYTHGRN